MAPVTAGMLYTFPVDPLQTELDPEIVPAAFGKDLTVIALLLAVPLPQELTGVTVTFPLLAPKVTVMLAVPVPAVMEAPEGTVQL